MADWNFDISEAPRGGLVDRQTSRSDKEGNPVVVSEWVSPRVIAASSCGKVISTRWMPESERWEMFTKESPPIAWQPWPAHPTTGAAS